MTEGVDTMSQQKVDRYKEQKANRKEIMRKEKRAKAFRKCVAGLVCLVLVGWLGYSVYDTYTGDKGREMVEVDYGAMTEYLNGLSESVE